MNGSTENMEQNISIETEEKQNVVHDTRPTLTAEKREELQRFMQMLDEDELSPLNDLIEPESQFNDDDDDDYTNNHDILDANTDLQNTEALDPNTVPSLNQAILDIHDKDLNIVHSLNPEQREELEASPQYLLRCNLQKLLNMIPPGIPQSDDRLNINDIDNELQVKMYNKMIQFKQYQHCMNNDSNAIEEARDDGLVIKELI